MNALKKNLLFLGSLLLHSKDSKIIFYHDVFDQKQNTDMGTPLELFKQHLTTVEKSGFEIVSQISQTQKQIQITFDDGFRGLWECRKFFYKQNWKPTVFIAVDLIGQDGYLSRNEILELQEQGFIFQSHGWKHQVLTDFHGQDLIHEIAGSKQYLSELLNKEVDELCFPVGFFSEEILKCCSAAGYRKLYSSIPGNYDHPVFPQVVRRNLVQFYSAKEVSWVLHGALPPFAKRYFNMHFHK